MTNANLLCTLVSLASHIVDYILFCLRVNSIRRIVSASAESNDGWSFHNRCLLICTMTINEFFDVCELLWRNLSSENVNEVRIIIICSLRPVFLEVHRNAHVAKTFEKINRVSIDAFSHNYFFLILYKIIVYVVLVWLLH